MAGSQLSKLKQGSVFFFSVVFLILMSLCHKYVVYRANTRCDVFILKILFKSMKKCYI